MTDIVTDPGVIMDWVFEVCARAAHEVNRAYCIALGDMSQVSWDDAPEWQKSSALHGVGAALRGAGPAASHEGWLREKAATGWKYGPVKDAAKKEHPCCVPYAELPLEQQQKDALFVAVVLATFSALRNTDRWLGRGGHAPLAGA